MKKKTFIKEICNILYECKTTATVGVITFLLLVYLRNNTAVIKVNFGLYIIIATILTLASMLLASQYDWYLFTKEKQQN